MEDNNIPSEGSSALVVPNCRVCKHPRRADIDQMLILGVNYDDIIKYLGAEIGEVTKNSLSNHKLKHIDLNQCPAEIPAAVQTNLLETHDRVFELQMENQRLRAEVLLANKKERITQQAAVCLSVIDQLPNVLDTCTIKDVLMANKMLREIMGDHIEKKEVQVDVTGELNLPDDVLKDIGNLLAESKRAENNG